MDEAGKDEPADRPPNCDDSRSTAATRIPKEPHRDGEGDPIDNNQDRAVDDGGDKQR